MFVRVARAAPRAGLSASTSASLHAPLMRAFSRQALLETTGAATQPSAQSISTLGSSSDAHSGARSHSSSSHRRRTSSGSSVGPSLSSVLAQPHTLLSRREGLHMPVHCASTNSPSLVSTPAARQAAAAAAAVGAAAASQKATVPFVPQISSVSRRQPNTPVLSSTSPAPSEESSSSPGASHGHPQLATIRGVVEKVLFHNERSGNTILHVHSPDANQTVAVVTSSPKVWPGEAFEARGFWQNSAKHGHQFNATKVILQPLPLSVRNPLAFLQSSLSGVGPKSAQLLHDKFGESIFEALDKEDPAVGSIKGLGKAKVKALFKSWKDIKARRFLAATLSTRGEFSVAQTISAVETVCSNPDNDPYDILSKDPYVFVRTRLGFDFGTIDRMAQHMGVARDDPRRIEAAILHSIHDEENSGHCAGPRSTVIKKAGSLISLDITKAQVEKVLAKGNIVAEDIRGVQCLYDSRLYKKELEVAEMLKQLTKGTPSWSKQVSIKSLNFEKYMLSKSQKHAITTILGSKVSVLTGGPGVGKTKVVGTLVEILKPLDVRMTLCAPTGRAAVRLQDSAGLPASTIHRTLFVSKEEGKVSLSDSSSGDRKTRFHKDNPLETDLVVVDESSMVDIELMHLLLQAIPPHASLLLVGDADQLPSVGPGNVLADIITSGVCPTSRLIEVHRQGAGSDITRVAAEVNTGNTAPKLATSLSALENGGSDVVFIHAEPDHAPHLIVDLVTKKIPALLPNLDIVRDIQVLCPMKSHGKVNTSALNVRLQAAVHELRRSQPSTSGVASIAPPSLDVSSASDPPQRLEIRGQSFKSAKNQFWKGDKVMQIVNDTAKDVYNGEVGTVVYINAKPGSAEALQVSFGDGRIVSYFAHEIDDHLLLAYATTVHKAQGCEYPVVILPIFMEHAALLQRKLLYTGITRARRLVVLVGQPAALLYTLANPNSDLDRWTKLMDILSQQL